MIVGELPIGALAAVRPASVLDSEKVEQGRLEFVDVGAILDDVPADVVDCAVAQPILDAVARA